MNKLAAGLFLFVAALLSWGCGGSSAPQVAPVMMPPQIDLHERETIGVIRFASSAKGELGPLATRRFTEAARRDQGLVKIVDLGSRDDALMSVKRDRLDADALVALARKNGLKTIVIGDLAVSNVRPDLHVDASLRSGSITAKVDATLEVQMFEADSGAAVWNRSARTTHSVGHVHIWNARDVAFDAKNPDEAYGGLVDDLVAQVSRPFQVSWVRP